MRSLWSGVPVRWCRKCIHEHPFSSASGSRVGRSTADAHTSTLNTVSRSAKFASTWLVSQTINTTIRHCVVGHHIWLQTFKTALWTLSVASLSRVMTLSDISSGTLVLSCSGLSWLDSSSASSDRSVLSSRSELAGCGRAVFKHPVDHHLTTTGGLNVNPKSRAASGLSAS